MNTEWMCRKTNRGWYLWKQSPANLQCEQLSDVIRDYQPEQITENVCTIQFVSLLNVEIKEAEKGPYVHHESPQMLI